MDVKIVGHRCADLLLVIQIQSNDLLNLLSLEFHLSLSLSDLLVEQLLWQSALMIESMVVIFVCYLSIAHQNFPIFFNHKLLPNHCSIDTNCYFDSILDLKRNNCLSLVLKMELKTDHQLVVQQKLSFIYQQNFCSFLSQDATWSMHQLAYDLLE